MRRTLKIARYSVVVFLIAFALLAGHAHPAMATPNTGPDPDDIEEQSYYGNSYPGVARQMKYAVSRDGYTDILNTRIKIYLPTATGTITVADADLCYNDSGDAGIPSYDGSYTLGAGNVSKFTMTNTGTGVITQYGTWRSTTGCWDDLKTFNVSGSALDPDTGMYPYFLDVEALANGTYLNLFKINAPAGSYVSQDSSFDTPSLGLESVYPIPPGSNPNSPNPSDPFRVYSTITNRFGADCSVTSSTYNSYAEIYDDDNSGTNYDVQPKQFQVRMQEYNRSTGAYIQDVYPNSVMWNSVNHTSPTTDSAGGWKDDLIVGTARYHTVWTNASKRRIRLYYTFNKDRIYRWKMYNVYYDNTLQLKSPFDSIFYYRECQQPDAKIKAGMSSSPAQVSPGQSATFTPSITVSNYRSSFTANCSIMRTSYTPSGTPTSLGSQPCQTTGSSNNIPINANGTITLKGNSYTVPTSLAPGSKVCDVITITNPTDSSYYANASDNTAEGCVNIIGRPFLTATNNDIWAGGRFDYSSNNCSGQTARNSKISSWNVSDSGANGRYGVTALGPIIGFGSAGQPAGTGFTFANTPSTGSLGAATRCIPNYYDLVGTGGEPWIGFPAMTADMGRKLYYSSTSMAMTVGGTVPKGTKVVLVVNGDLTIKGGNINYANTYGSANELSSLWVIVKGNIYIQENITNLSGFFVAQGTSTTPGKIHTCVRTNQISTYTPLTTNVCNNSLDVYGALLADQIYWQRTKGTTATGQPYAESVQFDPGLYLSNPLNTTGRTPTIQDSKELPPIY